MFAAAMCMGPSIMRYSPDIELARQMKPGRGVSPHLPQRMATEEKTRRGEET